MVLTRIKTDNILDREVYENDLADGAVTFAKLAGLSGGASGHVLTTDGLGGLLWTPAAGAPLSLDALVDVDVSTVPPIIGETLAWDGFNWVPQTSIPGNPSNLALNNITDVTIGNRQQNQFLRYDGAGQWVNAFVSAAYVQGLQLVGITGLLNSLTDVNVTGATASQRLGFDGTQWRAVDAATLDSIDLFLDVDTTTVLPVGGDALVWNGGTNQWEPFSVGLGASSNTYVVNDITARDAISAAEGDQAFVRSGVDGEYALYIWDAAWYLIGTADSAATDARTIEAIVVPATISPVLLGNVSAESRVTLITIDVTIAFDGAPSLTVGDAGDNARLIDDSLFDLGEIGTYSCTTDVVYSGVPDTDINGYFAAGGATVGSARILVSYV